MVKTEWFSALGERLGFNKEYFVIQNGATKDADGKPIYFISTPPGPKETLVGEPTRLAKGSLYVVLGVEEHERFSDENVLGHIFG